MPSGGEVAVPQATAIENPAPAGRLRVQRTLALCFIACLIEGGDIVSMGLAAPKVVHRFGFDARGMSYILTATIAGLMVGAVAGGRAGDRIGRKKVVLFAFAALAVFSLLTARMSSLAGFVIARLLCGLGLGGAFPNLIALASEASSARRRSSGVGIMFSGMPVGGASLGLLAARFGHGGDWTWIFYLGGVVPLLLLPFLIVGLPESAAFDATRGRRPAGAPDKSVTLSGALFADGAWRATIPLWISYAAAQMLVYLMNNWLPTLMVSRGFDFHRASLISAVENFGAAAGCVILGAAADRRGKALLLSLVFGLAAAGLASMAIVTSFAWLLVAGLVAGFAIVGGQLVLYALAPALYPVEVRAGGTGAAVSFGRLGGIAGPLIAGQLLAIGMSSAGVLLSAIPCALVAGVAAAAIARNLRREPASGP